MNNSLAVDILQNVKHLSHEVTPTFFAHAAESLAKKVGVTS
jgi:hypothetical protein